MYRQRDQNDHLPPAEFLLIDRGERFDTPLDERRLVDVPALITKAKSLIHPEYEWPAELSRHHFYYYANLYPYLREPWNPERFRELPIHIGLMPRQFENFIHVFSIHPPVPDREVMQYRLDAWDVARNLFTSARQTIQWEKRARRRREFMNRRLQALLLKNPSLVEEGFDGSDKISEEIIHEAFERNFRGFELHMQRNSLIPEEHRLIPYSESPRVVASSLGELIVPRAIRLTNAVAA
jgi:hypothetical protein